jgi:hypothetical protein
VIWLKQERAQDQQVERPLQQISLRRGATLLQIFCMRVLDYLQNVNRKAFGDDVMRPLRGSTRQRLGVGRKAGR